MKKTLIIFGHPDLKNSKINKKIYDTLDRETEKVSILKIEKDTVYDIKEIQNTIEKYDNLVFQFPFYWYSFPGHFKSFLDDILSYNWAYGSELEGKALTGKRLFLSISIGNDEFAYSKEGINKHTIDELVKPIKSICNITGMNFINTFKLYKTNDVTENDIKNYTISLLKNI